MRRDGYCRLDNVLKLPRFRGLRCTYDDVDEVVRTSSKRRFELWKETDAWWIRATQGHSLPGLDDDYLLHRLQPSDPDLPRFIVHGTKRACLGEILQRGLLAGGPWGQTYRAHVHFNTQMQGVTSGMREDSEVAVWVDLGRAILDVPFHMSSNGVILSRGAGGAIGVGYFHKVVDLETGTELLF